MALFCRDRQYNHLLHVLGMRTHWKALTGKWLPIVILHPTTGVQPFTARHQTVCPVVLRAGGASTVHFVRLARGEGGSQELAVGPQPRPCTSNGGPKRGCDRPNRCLHAGPAVPVASPSFKRMPGVHYVCPWPAKCHFGTSWEYRREHPSLTHGWSFRSFCREKTFFTCSAFALIQTGRKWVVTA